MIYQNYPLSEPEKVANVSSALHKAGTVPFGGVAGRNWSTISMFEVEDRRNMV